MNAIKFLSLTAFSLLSLGFSEPLRAQECFEVGDNSYTCTEDSITASHLRNGGATAIDAAQCGPDAGVYVCERDASFGFGNHAYLWDARTDQACGTSGISGSGNANGYEAGPSVDSCNFVPLSEGREDQIMNYCQANANNGLWVPGINDCHNAAADSVESSGSTYPGTPNGRF